MSVEVHVDWQGQTQLVGRLFEAPHSDAVTFAYADTWLARPGTFAIDPTSLPLRAGPHHGALLFGALRDCGPDRWGRLLIERAVRKQILERKPYQHLDYVLALDDVARIGALRLRADPAGPFLAASQGKLPPLIELAALLQATDAVHDESESAADLRFLMGAGSPLGGARPKSAVRLADGALAIAKFPAPDDIRDIAAGEVLALALARAAGISVAEHRLVSVEGRSVSVITRFDRSGNRRIPFVSANSLLGLSRDDPGAYDRLADGIRQLGDQVTGDLRELWRRLVFSLLASNYDDHLRNHGFLMHRPGRWSLSPAYDINPVPEIDRPRTTKTPIRQAGGEASVGVALETAGQFGLKLTDAKTIVHEVHSTVLRWREMGRKLRIKASTLDAYASAFENPAMEEARKLSHGPSRPT
ncbi:MAG TPA: type II toxin-antitoxin system HipA family toxin [Opitutaceae bacterium]|jgi:serine/threonine-protein kinase HipA